MRKAILLTFGILASAAMIGQNLHIDASKLLMNRVDVKPVTGFEAVPQSEVETVEFRPPVVTRMKSDDLCFEYLGETTYDLQTNSSVQNRVYIDNGYRAATWTFSETTPPASPDRGTAYGFNDNGAGWDVTAERVESFRTGWASLDKTASGREFITNHAGSGAINFIYRDAPDDPWTETLVPTAFGATGFVWARTVAGGADGNSIHMICPTTPEALGGAIENGQDGSLLYWRSQDGGDTWDIQDFQPAGTGSDSYLRYGGDTYAIASRGNTVAYAVFHDFADSYVMISEDNGDTWAQRFLWDFPIDLYQLDDGIDLDMDNVPDTIVSTDGSGAIHIDQNGLVHVSYGELRYVDADLADGNFSYFFVSDSLHYWNENMADYTSIVCAQLEDADGDEEFTFGTAFPATGTSMVSYPNFASDGDGNIYLVYSAMVDNLLDEFATFNFRHLFLIKSSDGGMTWTAPLDITPFDFLEEVEEGEFEAIYASVYPEIMDNKLSLVYHHDYSPGTVVNEDDPLDSDNIVVYLEVDLDLIPTSIQEVAEESPFKLYPNPVDGNTIFLDGTSADYVYILRDMLGKEVLTGRMQDGRTQIDLPSLSEGMYLLDMTNGIHRYSEKLSIR